jgi:hypothetical protein
MWLRPACRNVTNAAEDSLLFTNHLRNANKACRVRCPSLRTVFPHLVRLADTMIGLSVYRFFIESSCAVPLYDSLWNPNKFAYNLEHIPTGLDCLDHMVEAEPVFNTRISVRQMLSAWSRPYLVGRTALLFRTLTQRVPPQPHLRPNRMTPAIHEYLRSTTKLLRPRETVSSFSAADKSKPRKLTTPKQLHH